MPPKLLAINAGSSSLKFALFGVADAQEPVAELRGRITRIGTGTAMEVSDLNARFRGWVYELPPFSFANMNRKIDDLLKPESPET